MRRTSLLILVLSTAVTAHFACSNAQIATQVYEDGVRLQREKKNVEAVARFSEAVRLKPDYALAYFELGQSLQSLGRYAEAIAAYDSAIRLDPMMAGAYLKRGYAKDAVNGGSGLADINTGVRLSPLAIPGVPPPLVTTGMPSLSQIPLSGGSQAAAILKQSTEGGAKPPSAFDAYLDQLIRSAGKPEKPRETPSDHFWHQFDKSSRTISPGSPLFPPSERRQITDDIFNRALPSPAPAAPGPPRATEPAQGPADTAKLAGDLEVMDDFVQWLKDNKKDPSQPAETVTWRTNFDGMAMLATIYKMPLVLYFPGSETTMVGIWQLNLIPIGNKAYFFVADTANESTRADLEETATLFNVRTYPTVIVARLMPPIRNTTTPANLDIQVRCEGQPLPACNQQVLDWFERN